MKKQLILLSSLLALHGIAQAGDNWSSGVSVSVSGRVAYGMVSGAHNTVGDPNSMLYCAGIAYSNGTYFGMCSATDYNGVTVSCTTTQASLVQHMVNLSSDSWTTFAFDASGTCTYVSVEQMSSTPPKVGS
jgi:hypothetical protein